MRDEEVITPSDVGSTEGEREGPEDAGQGARPPGRRRRRQGWNRPDVLATISIGGMLGASARYGVARWLPAGPGGFPWATFCTNVSGSFLLGLFLVLVVERLPPSRYLRPFVASGILGAFTTMSTYEVETALLIKDGHAATGLAYGIGSLGAGLALAYAGTLAGRLVAGVHVLEHVGRGASE